MMGAATMEDIGDGGIRVTVDDSVADAEATSAVEGSDIETAPAAPAAPADVGGDNAATEVEAGTQDDLAIKQEEAAQSVLDAAGLSMQSFADEYAEKGELSEESMSSLVNKAGIPREVVEGYIAGQEALALQSSEAITSKAFEIAGSKAEYTNLTAWAANNLTDAEQSAFNESVSSQNPAITEQAIRGLVQRHQASEGYEGSAISGTTVASNRADIYEDKSQMLTDLADERYQQSPAFRTKVDSKVARSMENHGGSIPS
jgi:hypothetical protein